MRPEPSKRDATLVARYVDDEMTGVERAGFEARLAQDPALQVAVSEMESLRGWFRGGRDEPLVPASPGFAASVIAAARRLPTRDELLEQESAGDRESELVDWSRRISLAAAVIFGVSMLLFMTLRISSEATRLEAAPARLRLEMERLDDAIRKKQAGGAESRGR